MMMASSTTFAISSTIVGAATAAAAAPSNGNCDRAAGVLCASRANPAIHVPLLQSSGLRCCPPQFLLHRRKTTDRKTFSLGVRAISTNEFKIGTNIELDGAPWKVLEVLHVKPGTGAAFVRAKLRNYVTGNTVDRTFQAGEKIPLAEVQKDVNQFSYMDGEQFVIMDMGSKEEDDDDWEKEIFEDFSRPSGTYGRRRTGDWDEEVESNSAKEEASQGDWSVKARARAIKAIEERELPVGALLDDGGKKKRRRKKKKKAPAPLDMRLTKAKLERLEKIAKALDEKGLLKGDDRLKESLMENPLMKAVGSGEGLSALGNYWKSMGNSTAGEIRTADAANPGESRGFSNRVSTPTAKNPESPGPRVYLAPSKQKRQEDFDLNRKLVGAADAAEVLSVVGEVIEDRMWGNDSPLSPFNVSTALHRIAKHMEAVPMHKSDRLAFARQKVMAQLVSAAVEALPNCSGQSISNIAWALSKVGGYSLYWTEMDLLAEVAITKLSDLDPQHIANIAGAFASMQHSIPRLFETLERRASVCYREFQSQELAQLLWAFATLNQPVKLLLDSLDSECQRSLHRMGERAETIDVRPSGEDDMLPQSLADSFLTAKPLNSEVDVGRKSQGKAFVGLESNHEADVFKSKQSSTWALGKNCLKTFSVSELASLSWSYTVLDHLEGPSFFLIWQAILDKGLGIRTPVKVLPCPALQLAQLYQTNLSLRLEYPHLGLSLGEPLGKLALREWEAKKTGLTATSVTQLNVERLLVGMGRRWVAEYTDADYSLDAALVEDRICLEIDGPSHFARNTGAPLGHTMLKRRQLGAAGWTVLSIPYQEWDDQVGEQEQRLYLHNLLRTSLPTHKTSGHI